MKIKYKTFKVRENRVGGIASSVDKDIDNLRARGWHVRSVWCHTNGSVYITAWTEEGADDEKR